MKIKLVAVLLVFCLFSQMVMPVAFAEPTAADTLAVDNTYLQVSMKNDGSSYGINTIDGHPLKPLDKNQPLLYDGDDILSTSYTTVRIKRNGKTKNYVFGSDDGVYVTKPEYRLTGSNETIYSSWKVDDVLVEQSIVVSNDMTSVEAGYADIKYNYTNQGTDSAEVGIRILLDTKIADNDGGSFFVNGEGMPITRETVLTGSKIPKWYRISDNTFYSTTSAFGLFENDMMTKPDEVHIGHWFNLANSLWDFAPNSSMDFSDAYNQYLYADSAIAMLWKPSELAAGASRVNETLYGLGDLTGTETMKDNFIVNVRQEEPLQVEKNTSTGAMQYKNDGIITLLVSIDNSANNRKLVDAKLKLVFEDKKIDANTGKITNYPAVWVVPKSDTETDEEKTERETIYLGDINAGEIKTNIELKLKANPVYLNSAKKETTDSTGNTPAPITVRKVTMEVSDYENSQATIASKIITLPSLGQSKPDIGFVTVNPSTVYFKGPAFISVVGSGSDFGVLTDTSLWDIYLKKVNVPKPANSDGDGTEEINITSEQYIYVDNSKNVSVDTENKQLGVLFDLEGNLGKYEIHITFKGQLSYMEEIVLKDGNCVEGSKDEIYKSRGYSIAVVSRLTDLNTSPPEYETRLISPQGALAAETRFATYKKKLEEAGGEILMEARGMFKINYFYPNFPRSFEPGHNNDNAYEIASTKENANISGFESISDSDPVKINRILYYENKQPLRITKDNERIKMLGDGRLTVIGASTIWEHGWQVDFLTKSLYYTFDGDAVENDPTMTKKAPRLEFLGAGFLLSSFSGLVFDLSYGILGKDDDYYTISFGGQMALPLGFSPKPLMSSDSGGSSGSSNSSASGSGTPTTQTATTTVSETKWVSAKPSTGVKTSQLFENATTPSSPATNNTSTGGSTQTTPSANSGTTFLDKTRVFENQGKLAINIDSVLFGEHESEKETDNGVATGFIGVAAELSIELPDYCFPASGSQDKNPTVEKGATKAPSAPVPTASPTTLVGQAQQKKYAASFKGGPMSGFGIGVKVNTFDWMFGVDLSMKFGPMSCAARFTICEIPAGAMLDTLYCEVSGFEIPIADTGAFITGLGGGFSDLAALFQSGYDGPPPLTLYLMLMMKFVAFGVRGDVAVSARGMSFDILGAPAGMDFIKLMGSLEASWDDGFRAQIGAKIQVSDFILGQISLGMKTKPEYSFLGKIAGSLTIPGLGSIANASFLVSDEYIAGGAKLCIFSGGIIYYYDSKKVKYLTSSEIDRLEVIDIDSIESNSSDTTGITGKSSASKANAMKLSDSDAEATANLSFLEARTVVDKATGQESVIAFGAGAKAIRTSIPKYSTNSGDGDMILYSPQANPCSYSFNIDNTLADKKQKDYVVRINYEGDIKPRLSLTAPGGNVALTEYDMDLTQADNDAAGANMMFGERTNDQSGIISKYVYISLDADTLSAGDWQITSTNGVPILCTELTIPSFKAGVTNVTAVQNAEKLDVSWAAPENSEINVAMVPVDANGNPVRDTIYNEDGSAMKDDDGNDLTVENAGYTITQGKKSDAAVTEIDIPDGVPTGRYKVRVDCIANKTTLTSEYSDNVITHTNPFTLQTPEIIHAKAIGNGTIEVKAKLDKNATGMECLIYRKTALNPNWQQLMGIGGYVGAYEGFYETDDEGNKIITANFAGGINIVDDNGAVIRRVEVTPGDLYKVKAIAVNADEGTDYMPSETVVFGDTTPIFLPVPDKPEIELVVSDGAYSEGKTEKGFDYTQTDTDDILIQYEIKNAYDENGAIKNAFKDVKVDIYFDDLKYGDTIHNEYSEEADNTDSFKGYAYAKLTDGEHFVKLVAENADGDRTVEVKRVSIDSVPADLKIVKPITGEYVSPDNGIDIAFISDIGSQYEIYMDGVKVNSGKVTATVVADSEGRDASQNGLVKYTYNVSDKAKYSYELEIRITDTVGHKTDYKATLLNSIIKDIDDLKIKKLSSNETTMCQEFCAVALSSDGGELLTLPSGLVRWELITEDPLTTVTEQSDNNVFVQSRKIDAGIDFVPDYALKATLPLTANYSLTDIYSDTNIGKDSTKPESGSENSGGGGGAGVSRYTITTGVEGNGVITPSARMIKGSDLVIKATPAQGNRLAAIYVDGVTIDISRLVPDKNGSYAYEFTAISAAHSIKAVFEPSPAWPFADVAEDDSLNWYYSAVKFAYEAKLFNGTSETTFDPTDEMTRAMFVTVLGRLHEKLLESIPETTDKRFSDVLTDEWYTKYITWASENGLVKGYDETTFGTDDPITREQIATILIRYIDDFAKLALEIKYEKSEFSDAAEISEWAKDSVAKIKQYGLVMGKGNNAFDPKGFAQRAEIAAILQRLTSELALKY